MTTATSIKTAVSASEDGQPDRTFPGCDLIFVSLEDWDEIWRRNQFLCAELAERHPTHRILFVGLSQNLARSVLRQGWNVLFRKLSTTAPGFPNITLFKPWQIFPNRFWPGRWFNDWSARRQVNRLSARLGLHQPVLWLNPHDAVHMAGHMGESAVVYDVTDDWSQVSQSAARRKRTVRADAKLCRQADAVIVCSETLREGKETLSRRVHLVPNGVNTAHYAKQVHPLSKPPAAKRWRGRVFGYTGTLHGDRLDIELIRRFATIMGNSGSVVLIGPDHLREVERERLCLPNIFLVGKVPYASLPEYTHWFDVCIVPHKVTPFTESLNPLKLWEYLALGKPIVATRVAGFRDYPQFVHLAEGAEEFAARSRQAMSEPEHLAPHRRAEASRHSWATRCDAVERILADCLERRVGSPVQA